MAETGQVPEIGARLMAAGASAEASRAVYLDDLSTRNRLIVEACDDGFAWREVAGWVGVSMARIQQIIAAQPARAGA